MRHPMRRLGARLPNHHPDMGMAPVKRECGYCGETMGRNLMVKLPNGLYACGDCPAGGERDKRR